MSSHMSLWLWHLVHGISSVFLKSAVLFAGYDTKIFSFIFFPFGSSEIKFRKHICPVEWISFKSRHLEIHLNY